MNQELLDDVYQDHILYHAEESPHFGELPNATVTTARRNPRCGDHVRLGIVVRSDGVIERARFVGRGCVISRAGAAILCEHIEGKPIRDVLSLTEESLLQKLRVPLTAGKQQCALLALFALREALA